MAQNDATNTEVLHSPWPSPSTIQEKMVKAYESLLRIREAAIRDENLIFTSLHHHLTVGMLALSFFRLNNYAVPGIDKVTKEEYLRNLERNLTALRNKLINEEYYFTPVKRVYIPKPDGGKRPLGICIIEDKIVQGAVKLILEAIYDRHFVGFSYGFRVGTRAHDALDALYVAITEYPVNYILDADITKCFDNINIDILMEILTLKIEDRPLLRLIDRMVRTGVLEELTIHKTLNGVIQGSVISPLLANIYLHYILDKFYTYWRANMNNKNEFSCMVRYADDFILGFQRKTQAERFLTILKDRLKCGGLDLHKDKTRLIEFGRYARENRKRRGEGKPETFDFLGFRHICGITWKGRRFKLVRKTISERRNNKLNEMYEALRILLLCGTKVDMVVKRVNRVLTGYYNYFAIHDNLESLIGFRHKICRFLFKLINRRSQKANMNWEQFNNAVEPKIVLPKVVHAYPNQRMANRQKELRSLRYTTAVYNIPNSLAQA